MNKILIISENPSKIRSIHSKIISLFPETEFHAMLLSENIKKIFLEKSYFIKTSYPLSLNIDEISGFVKSINPLFIFTTSELQIKSLAAAISASLNAGILTDISDIIRENESIYFLKPYIDGKLAKLAVKTLPAVITLSVNESTESENGPYMPCEIKISSSTTITTEKNKHSQNYAIEKARKVIGIGRGVKKSDIELIKKFANAINAVIGYTRPAREEFETSAEYQIGISGKNISPDLYIAIGISGKEHHIRGITRAKLVIAVNSDPQAPIKKIADYFICCDYRKFISKVLEF